MIVTLRDGTIDLTLLKYNILPDNANVHTYNLRHDETLII